MNEIRHQNFNPSGNAVQRDLGRPAPAGAADHRRVWRGSTVLSNKPLMQAVD
jgi:hypothetical protein